MKEIAHYVTYGSMPS